MNLEELRKRFWWLIDDDPTNPRLVASDVLTGIINDGIRSLAEVIRKVGYDATLVPDAGGYVELPDDLVRPMLVKYGDNELTPIEDVHQSPTLLTDEDEGSADTTRYMLTERNKMLLFDAPKEPYKTLHLWYIKYPTLLADDGDEPVDIPPEYHEALVTVYARAQYALKMGWLTQYQTLMLLWEETKKEIGGVIEGRVKPVRYDEAVNFKW